MEIKSTVIDLKLLYRSSRDGSKAGDLHLRCQGKGNTLTVIEDTNGSVFGSYSEGEWEKSSPTFDGNDSFFFCLTDNTPEKNDLFAKTPFRHDLDPGHNTLYFGVDFYISSNGQGFCNIGSQTGCGARSAGVFTVK